MAGFLNVCRFFPTAGGTTDWTFSAAVIGYASPALAGVVNGTLYKYRAESDDLSQWEVGEGAYNTGTGVLARTTVLYNSSGTGTAAGQSGAGTKISFTTAPQVAIVILSPDLPNLTTPNKFTDTTEATGAGTTAAGIISGGFEILKKLFVTGIAAFTNATAASSTTTGAVVVTGGIASQAQMFAPQFLAAGVSSSVAHFDAGGSASVVLANGANVAITPVSTVRPWLLMIGETNVFGGSAVILNAGGATGTIIIQTGTTYVMSAAPAAGKVGIAWDAGSSQHRLFNNQGATCTFRILLLG